MASVRKKLGPTFSILVSGLHRMSLVVVSSRWREPTAETTRLEVELLHCGAGSTEMIGTVGAVTGTMVTIGSGRGAIVVEVIGLVGRGGLENGIGPRSLACLKLFERVLLTCQSMTIEAVLSRVELLVEF